MIKLVILVIYLIYLMNLIVKLINNKYIKKSMGIILDGIERD